MGYIPYPNASNPGVVVGVVAWPPDGGAGGGAPGNPIPPACPGRGGGVLRKEGSNASNPVTAERGAAVVEN